MNKKLIASVVVVIVALGVGFLLFNKDQQSSENQNPNIQNTKGNTTQKPEIASKDISTWKYFDEMQPSVRYPVNWTAEREIYTRTKEEIEEIERANNANNSEHFSVDIEPEPSLMVGIKIYPTNSAGYKEDDYIRIGGRRVCPETVEQYGPKAYWKWENAGGIEKDQKAPTKHFCDPNTGTPIDTWSTNPEILEVFDLLINNLAYG